MWGQMQTPEDLGSEGAAPGRAQAWHARGPGFHPQRHKNKIEMDLKQNDLVESEHWEVIGRLA